MSLFTARTPQEASALLPDNGEPVVILPVFNSYSDVVRCYEAFFRNTAADVPLLVVDDAGWDRRTVDVLETVFSKNAPDHDVVVLRQTSNRGFLLSMNAAFSASGRADVVILNSDVIVGPEWLRRLQDAAYSTSTVATVTALTNHGTILSVPERNRATDDVPGALSVDEAARRVAAGSPRLRPRIPTAIGHCTYMKRAMFDVVGYFDEAFSPGYGEEVDLCQRAIAAGFEHIVADDVYVFHKGGSSFGRSSEIERRKVEHELIVQKRYDYYGPWVRRVAADEHSTLAAALLAARRSLLGMTVAVDGMCLGPLPAGTQIVVVETARALAARADVAQVILHTPQIVPGYVTEALRNSPKVVVSPTSINVPPAKRAHVVYRPYQVNEEDELEWLRQAGERVVVNQLDFIAYHDAAYFGTDELWRRYRNLAKLAAFSVDGLTYLSEHSLQAAVAEGLLPTGKPHKVVYCGTEHTTIVAPRAIRPGSMEGIEHDFMLCLGVSYLHKNRVFALKMMLAMWEQGWRGSLVLAGAQPPFGSSVTAEAEFLLMHRELAAHVVTLGMVSEAEKVWLYQNAGLVLYPTTSEGFGLIPFEAANMGVACLATRCGSLDEVLPKELATITEFEPTKAAALALSIVADPSAREQLVSQILQRGKDFTWEKVADDVMSVLTEVTGRPASRVVAITSESGYSALRELPTGGGNAKATLHAVDVVIKFFIDRPNLRTKLVPPGSARQLRARSLIGVVRRHL